MGWIEELDKQIEKVAYQVNTENSRDFGDADSKTIPPAVQEATGMSQETWDSMPDRATRQKIIDDVAAQNPPADPFGDIAYAEGGGERYDEFSLDVGEQVSPQMWRYSLMREAPQDRTQAGKQALKKNPLAGFTTGVSYVARINSMSPDELEGFQRQLYAAGFYGDVEGQKSQEPIWGAPDEPTIRATKLLAYTTMRFKGKLSIVEVLDRFAKMNDANGDGKPDGTEREKPKPVVQLTNPLDLAAAAQEQSVDLMGRRLGEGEVGGVTGGYSGTEAAAQTAAQMAQIENTGGTITRESSPSAWAEAQIRSQYGDEVDAYSYLGLVNTLMQRLGLAG